MKKTLLAALLALSVLLSAPAMAEVNVSIGISLPPPVAFQTPPTVVPLPDTNDVYVVPYTDADIFFWDGWWWRFWDGRWYRSRYYDRGWRYYDEVPDFYYDIDPGWRAYTREHEWRGHRWDYQPIPYSTLQHNWRTWHKNRHWERQRAWNVQNYQPPPQRSQPPSSAQRVQPAERHHERPAQSMQPADRRHDQPAPHPAPAERTQPHTAPQPPHAAPEVPHAQPHQGGPPEGHHEGGEEHRH